MKNIIFDLDGTLIDSAPSIFRCLNQALDEHKIDVSRNFDNSLIGPPLNTVLERILGTKSTLAISPVLNSFKSFYDEEGFKLSSPYDGVVDLIDSLIDIGHNLFIATNKRIAPTRSIISYLGWNKYFCAVYGVDSISSANGNSSKSYLIGDLLIDQKIESFNSIYVGDRLEDQEAAEKNRLNTVTACWGYGDYSNLTIYKNVAQTLDELNSFLNKK